MYSAIHLSHGVNGVTTKAYVNNLYADFVNYGILVDGAGSDFQVANMTTQNNDQTNSGTTLPNGYGVWINTTGVTGQIGNLYSKLTAGPAVEVDGNSNRINIANLRANTYGTPGAGTPAVNVADTGANPSNQVYVGNKEQLQGTAPLVLFNGGGNGGRERFVMMNDVGGANPNEARAYSAVPGNAPQLAAIGGDANIDLYLNGKGTSGVRLQSSGQTVLRADNLNASTNDFLLRGGSGTMNWIAEGGDADIDVYLTPKGPTGGVRLQAAGDTVLRVDNPTASGDDLLMRGGAATMTLLPEGAEAAIDLYLDAKAAGSVRLQANGGTVLRVDNPAPGTSDLLVRAGSATLALTVEDPASSANLVLNPKGAGLVSTANCPPSTDNSSNLACTSWVRSWVLAQGFAAGITALTGDVSASGTGSVAASLASVGTAGTVGDATHIAQVTTDAKGRVTADSPVAIAFPVSSVAGRGGAVALTLADIAGLGPLAAQSLPSQTVVGTTPTGALVAAASQGTGGKVQLSTGGTTAGHCVEYDASGNTIDAGAACGTGGGGGITALTGDVTASGAGSVAATLAGVGTAGTYTKVTTDAKGRVVTGGGLIAADITAALGFTPLPSGSPTAAGTLTVSGVNSLGLSGATTGAAPTIAAAGGDASVDLALAAAGPSGSARLLANGATVLRVANPGAGNSDILVQSGSAIASLSVESSATAAGLALVPKGAGVVTAPTAAASDNSTTVATTAFVRSVGYAPAAAPSLSGTTTISGTNSITLAGATTGNGPVIAAVGGDSAVDLNLTSLGTGSVRIKSNGVNVIRTDSPGPGTSDLLVRSGAGTVALTLEDPGANASLTINPKGTGVVNVPTAATSSNGTTAASTAFVRSVLPCVQPQAGRAYAPPGGSPATLPLPNSATVQAVYALPIVLCGSRQMTALAFEITTATSAAFSARMALYADSAGQPSGAPLADTGTMTIAANATGAQIGAISGGPTLQPGVYWVTFQSSYVTAPATVRAISVASPGGMTTALGYSLAAGAAIAVTADLYQNGTFGAPPNPFGTPTGYGSANAPMVWVQF
jgi:hypothetical protein